MTEIGHNGGNRPKVYRIIHPDDYRSAAPGHYDFEANEHVYTKIKVFDKDQHKTTELYTLNCTVESDNGTKYTIKNGRVFDKNGKAVKDNILTLNRYHAAIVEAAAAAGEGASKHKLNEYDFTGGMFQDTAEKYLQKNKSEYHITEANADGGVFTALTQTKDGRNGSSIQIKFTK